MADIREKCKCRFCSCEDAFIARDGEREYVECPVCGNYIFPFSSAFLLDERFGDAYGEKYDLPKLVSYLYHNKVHDRYAFVGTESALRQYRSCKPQSVAFLVDPETVENWYPKTFEERINHILLLWAKKSNYIGESSQIGVNELNPFFFLVNKVRTHKWDQEMRFIVRYLGNEGLIENPIANEKMDQYIAGLKVSEFTHFILSAKAWGKIYELQKDKVNNKNVFVAMSFHKSADDIRLAIKKGIEQAKYSSLLMDEIVHNHQIVPEMLRLIKESRFMIMDITQPNFGAYYEAGYALGLGKEVIITCSQEVWDKKDFSCEFNADCHYKQIASKPHFDIAQKQVLKWKDYADLTKQLEEWIKEIIG